MDKSYARIIVFLILAFHVLATLWTSYTWFSDYSGWTIYHCTPILDVVFTATWLGIALQKRWAAFVYFLLVFQELMVKLFFGKYVFGEVFGDVFFPLDLIFAFVILILYKLHFGERTASAN